MNTENNSGLLGPMGVAFLAAAALAVAFSMPSAWSQELGYAPVKEPAGVTAINGSLKGTLNESLPSAAVADEKAAAIWEQQEADAAKRVANICPVLVGPTRYRKHALRSEKCLRRVAAFKQAEQQEFPYSQPSPLGKGTLIAGTPVAEAPPQTTADELHRSWGSTPILPLGFQPKRWVLASANPADIPAPRPEVGPLPVISSAAAPVKPAAAAPKAEWHPLAYYEQALKPARDAYATDVPAVSPVSFGLLAGALFGDGPSRGSVGGVLWVEGPHMGWGNTRLVATAEPEVRFDAHTVRVALPLQAGLSAPVAGRWEVYGLLGPMLSEGSGGFGWGGGGAVGVAYAYNANLKLRLQVGSDSEHVDGAWVNSLAVKGGITYPLYND